MPLWYPSYYVGYVMKWRRDKVDKVDKTKLLELLAEEVIRIGLPAVPTL